MRRSLLVLLFVIAAIPLAAGRHNGYYHGGRGLSVSTDDWEPITRCSQIDVTYDGNHINMVEEDIPVGSVRSLRIRPSHNGGVIVIGDSSSYSVKACKAAYLGGSSESIRIGAHGDNISADFPDDVGAVVYFLVHTPRDGSVDLEASNGPITVRDLTNGTINARTQNGPISVNLDGNFWSNGSLDASTHNGPLSLKIPSGYRSGVVVESDGRGPVSCRAEACRDSKRTWDDEDNRRIELGSGPQAVHLSTVNGPVSVKERD